MRSASAYSRHGSLTGHVAQTRRAESTPTPSLGKKTAGRCWRLLPSIIQLVSIRPSVPQQYGAGPRSASPTFVEVGRAVGPPPRSVPIVTCVPFLRSFLVQHDDDIEIEVEPEEPTRPSWLLDEPTWNDEPRIADATETVPLA